MIPNTGKYLPPVSQYIPLVSAISPRTLSRRLGVRPAWPRTEALARRMGRAPVEKGLMWLLTLPMMWPLMPAKGVAWIAESLEQEAAEQRDMDKRLEEKRLSLEMRREMEEITEEEFKKRTEEIDRKLEELKEPSK